MNITRPQGLKYYGGKNGSRKLGQWVASHIPYGNSYVEPFAGMGGVLLQREPSKIEIINDLDSRVSDFWEVVRDRNDELCERLNDTAYDENAYKKIWQTDWAKKDIVWRAWAFTVLVTQTFAGRASSCSFSRAYKYYSKRTSQYSEYAISRVESLKDRLKGVQIYNLDAKHLLSKMSEDVDAVIYCDPPYYSGIDDYKERGYDVDELSDVLLSQKGKVAISGYRGEWDHLNWESREFEKNLKCLNVANEKPQVEILYANYELACPKSEINT